MSYELGHEKGRSGQGASTKQPIPKMHNRHTALQTVITFLLHPPQLRALHLYFFFSFLTWNSSSCYLYELTMVCAFTQIWCFSSDCTPFVPPLGCIRWRHPLHIFVGFLCLPSALSSLQRGLWSDSPNHQCFFRLIVSVIFRIPWQWCICLLHGQILLSLGI